MLRNSISLAVIAIATLLFTFTFGCSLNKPSLEIEAQVIYQIGGPQPVARETFYLLDADVKQLSDLNNAYESSPIEYPRLRRKRYSDFLMEDGRAFWTSHVVQSVRTDFKGRATFENIKPGDYWVLGRTETRGGDHISWNIKVSVGKGENKLMLSNDNSGFQ